MQTISKIVCTIIKAKRILHFIARTTKMCKNANSKCFKMPQ